MGHTHIYVQHDAPACSSPSIHHGCSIICRTTGAHVTRYPGHIWLRTVIGVKAMDPDILFLGIVVTCITIVFVLGVTAGCGCTYWRRKADRGQTRAPQHSAERTSGTVDHRETRREARRRSLALTRALSLEPTKFEFGVGPGKAFLIKEEFQKALQAAKHLGSRPDTSRVIRKPRAE